MDVLALSSAMYLSIGSNPYTGKMVGLVTIPCMLVTLSSPVRVAFGARAFISLFTPQDRPARPPGELPPLSLTSSLGLS